MKSVNLTNEQAVLQLVKEHPLLRARDLQKQGLPTVALTKLVCRSRLADPFSRRVPAYSDSLLRNWSANLQISSRNASFLRQPAGIPDCP